MPSPRQQQQLKAKQAELNAAEDRISATYRALFTSADGSEVLDDLNERFYPDPILVKGDPYATHVLIGYRTILDYIAKRVRGEPQ